VNSQVALARKHHPPPELLDAQLQWFIEFVTAFEVASRTTCRKNLKAPGAVVNQQTNCSFDVLVWSSLFRVESSTTIKSVWWPRDEYRIGGDCGTVFKPSLPMPHSSAVLRLAPGRWDSFLLKEINMRMRFFLTLLFSACPTSLPVERIACLTKDDCPSNCSCTDGRCILGTASALPVAPPSTLDAIAPVIADEVAQAAIRVTLRDANSAPVARAMVTLTASGSNNTFVAASGLTDAAGIFSTGLWSSKAETKVITASFGDGQTLSTSVKFTPGTASLLKSTIASDKPSYQADGVDVASLKVTVLDALSNPIADTNTSLVITGMLNTLSANAGVTDLDGVFAATLKSTRAETKTVTATIGALSITKTIDFVTGTTVQANSSFVLSQTALVANGMQGSVATVQLLDGNSNAVVNQPVTLTMTGTGNLFEPVSGVTDASGKFVSNIKSRSAGVKTVTATAGAIKFSAQINFDPAPPQWTQRVPMKSPSARYGHSMAYDSVRKKVVLFGGSSATELFNDTWEWDGINWAKADALTAPSKRYNASMIFDSSINKMVLFGGQNMVPNDDTWTYDGTWTLLPLTTGPKPSSQYRYEFVYDPIRGQGVLFSGESVVTWLWKSGTWEQAAALFPSPYPNPFNNRLTFDSAGGQVFGYSGCVGVVCTSYLYTWSGGSAWASTALSTAAIGVSARDGLLAFDSSRNRPMRFGGSTGTAALESTFEWAANAWKPLAPATNPTPSIQQSAASDTDRAKVVMFGGRKAIGGLSAETWEYGPQ
jgi:hypothetical protein